LEALEEFHSQNRPYLEQATDLVQINEPWSSNRFHGILSQAIAMEETLPQHILPEAFIPSRELYGHLLERTGDSEYRALASDMFLQNLKKKSLSSTITLWLVSSDALMNQLAKAQRRTTSKITTFLPLVAKRPHGEKWNHFAELLSITAELWKII